MTGIPAAALALLPLLAGEVAERWPGAPHPSVFAAQVEQETCPSLKHRHCWNPRAELKTAREYGFGLGQLTVTPKFDNFKASKSWDRSLSGWRWEDRYDPRMQLRALVVYDRNLWRGIRGTSSDRDRLAFTLSAYNGGAGGLAKDRRLCAATAGCDQGQWFGHVERTSFRAKVAAAGYGKSFFEINREYVHNVLVVRRPRYERAFD